MRKLPEGGNDISYAKGYLVTGNVGNAFAAKVKNLFGKHANLFFYGGRVICNANNGHIGSYDACVKAYGLHGLVPLLCNALQHNVVEIRGRSSLLIQNNLENLKIAAFKGTSKFFVELTEREPRRKLGAGNQVIIHKLLAVLPPALFQLFIQHLLLVRGMVCVESCKSVVGF